MRVKGVRKKRVIVNPKKYVIHKMEQNESDFTEIKEHKFFLKYYFVRRQTYKLGLSGYQRFD